MIALPSVIIAALASTRLEEIRLVQIMCIFFLKLNFGHQSSLSIGVLTPHILGFIYLIMLYWTWVGDSELSFVYFQD